MSKRYSVKLLFHYDTGRNLVRHLCEERIITFKTTGHRSAIRKAKKRAKACEYDYFNAENEQVFFRFLGIIDIIYLGIEVDDDEVWYNVGQRKIKGKKLTLEDDQLLLRLKGD